MCDDRTPVRGSAFATWVRDYDAASIDRTFLPPPGLQAQAAAMGCVATSTLKRAGESAQLLAPGRPFVRDAVFNEAEIPSSIPLRLALEPRYWSILARVPWFFGWSPGAESLREARGRADRAAERLVELARDHGSVLLVGHGMMNWLIRRALRRRGWRGPSSGFAYWSVATLQVTRRTSP